MSPQPRTIPSLAQKNTAWRLIAALFAVILVSIVIAADTGRAHPVIRAAGAMPWGDKIMHVLLLGTMSFLLNLAMSASTVRIVGIVFLKGSLLLALLATIEEMSQMFLPRRNWDLADLACNYVGIFVFGAAASLLAKRNTSGTGPPDLSSDVVRAG